MLQTLKSVDMFTRILTNLNILTYPKGGIYDTQKTLSFLVSKPDYIEKDFVEYFKRHMPRNNLCCNVLNDKIKFNNNCIIWFKNQILLDSIEDPNKYDNLYDSLVSLEDCDLVLQYLVLDKKIGCRV